MNEVQELTSEITIVLGMTIIWCFLTYLFTNKENIFTSGFSGIFSSSVRIKTKLENIHHAHNNHI